VLAAKTLLRDQKGTLVVNPAAAISRVVDGKLVDKPWRPDFVTLARKTNSLIYPLSITNLQNPRRFYVEGSFANGTRWDLTMLPHLHQKPDVQVHEPIDPNAEPWSKMDDDELARHIESWNNDQILPSDQAIQPAAVAKSFADLVEWAADTAAARAKAKKAKKAALPEKAGE
jgi:hypothetical protein